MSHDGGVWVIVERSGGFWVVVHGKGKRNGRKEMKSDTFLHMVMTTGRAPAPDCHSVRLRCHLRVLLGLVAIYGGSVL